MEGLPLLLDLRSLAQERFEKRGPDLRDIFGIILFVDRHCMKVHYNILSSIYL